MRVAFLVDGFNMYHSAKEVQKDLGSPRQPTRWLDLYNLSASFLPHFGSTAEIESVNYFSAYAHHVGQQGSVQRHENYVACLKSSGVQPQMARFKRKFVYCSGCKRRILRYEEKETDVAIAVALFEKFHLDECDIAVIVSGDTDLAPAASRAMRLFPGKQVVFGFPYKRHNKELADLAPGSFKIRRSKYTNHQLADPFVLPTGKSIAKPERW